MKKRIALWGGCALVVMAALLLVAKARWDARYYEGYDPVLPLDARVLKTIPPASGDDAEEGGARLYRRVELAFQGVEGEDRVPTVLVVPKWKGPHPCVIFLHGIGQKKEFIDDIAEPFVKAGFAMATFDQYTRGERRLSDDAGIVTEGLALRRRGALTVLETRRLVDYLLTRDDIAGERIYLVGASFGAITGATAFAFEPRIQAGVLVYGGGDLPVLLASDEARKELGVWTTPVAHLMAFLLAPSDPVRYIPWASPRPVLLQGGTHDRIVPPESGQALFDAAKDPKEIIWYDSDHIGLDEEHVWVVLGDAIEWLRDQDKAVRGGVEGRSHAT